MNEFDLPPLEVQHFVLDRARVASRLPVDAYTLSTLKFHQGQVLDHITHNLYYALEAEVLTDKLPPRTVEETYTVTSPKIPATWWDHFKAEKVAANKWYWRWLGKLKDPNFQVDSKTVTLRVDLERWISYPEAQNIPESFGPKYYGSTIKSSLWD